MKNFISLLFFIGVFGISSTLTFAGMGDTKYPCVNEPVTLNWTIANCSTVSNSPSSPACNLSSPPLSGGSGSSALPNASVSCSITINCSTGATDSAIGNIVVDQTKVWNGSACVVPPAPCNLPWGGTIVSGASVTAYSSSTVPFGSSCTSESRTCNDGTLSGAYTNSSCVVDPAVSCTLPWGGTTAHGASVTAYQTAYEPFPSTCTSESLVCNNGTLSGSYTYEICNIGTASFTSTPSCSITAGNSSCLSTLTWTSQHSSSVTLTDCGGGSYGSFGPGVKSSPVTVPYNSGCYQVRDMNNNILATANPVNSDCAVGTIWDPALSQCRLPTGGTLSANPQVCNISPSSPTCESTFTWTTSNPIGPAGVFGDLEYVGDTRVSESLLTVISPYAQLLPVFFSGQTFRLYNNGKELASTTITQVCLNGANNPPLCNAGASEMSVSNGSILSVLPASCIIPTGQSLCPVSLTWNVPNPVAVGRSAITRNNPNGDVYTDMDSGTNQPSSISGAYTDATFFLYNNGFEITSQTVPVTCSAGADRWDTTPAISGGQICADPQENAIAEVHGDMGYGTPELWFSCVDSNSYDILKNGNITPVRSGIITPDGDMSTVVINLTTLGEGNYTAVCKHGSVSDTTPTADIYTSTPPAPTVSINASPKTIDIGGKTTLSWNVLYPPLAGCTLTATAVCANNICTPEQTSAVTTINNLITNITTTTDASDPATYPGAPRTLATALKEPLVPNSPNPTATGKKTIDVSKSTNFTLQCGAVKASTLVRVTNSNEQ